MRSIWQKQSGGLFRSECLISLCSITHFCRWSSRNVLLPFFVYLQDLNLRHEAPNAQHLAETVRGTVSQRVPYISVFDYSFLPVEQHFFSGVAVLIALLGHARYKKAGQFSNCPTVFDCFFVKRS